MKNAQERINSRITEAGEWLGDREDRMVEITATEENEQKRMTRNEDSLTGLWNNIKQTNIRVTGVPEEEGKKKGTENILKKL